MAAQKKRINPFYVLLVLVGVAFAITACAYGVMSVKQLHAADWVTAPSLAGETSGMTADQAVTDRKFVAFMDRYGVSMMLTEVGILAFATLAAIGTDGWWAKSEKNES